MAQSRDLQRLLQLTEHWQQRRQGTYTAPAASLLDQCPAGPPAHQEGLAVPGAQPVSFR